MTCCKILTPSLLLLGRYEATNLGEWKNDFTLKGRVKVVARLRYSIVLGNVC